MPEALTPPKKPTTPGTENKRSKLLAATPSTNSMKTVTSQLDLPGNNKDKEKKEKEKQIGDKEKEDAQKTKAKFRRSVSLSNICIDIFSLIERCHPLQKRKRQQERRKK